MTLGTIVTEVPRHVIWVRCIGKICSMTLIAICKMQLVVAIGVTRLALHCDVRPSQREQCRTVVKCRASPIRSRMALRTIVAEIPRHVIWVRCLLELGLMTLVTIGVHQLVVTADMT